MADDSTTPAVKITPQDIKSSLRIEVTDDDDMIQQYINTAENYVQNAISSAVNIDDLYTHQQFKFAVSLLTQFWYQNRDIDMQNTPYQVRSMIQQLRGIIG